MDGRTSRNSLGLPDHSQTSNRGISLLSGLRLWGHCTYRDVGVKNGHDKVNIQTSVKISISTFTKIIFVKKSLRRICGEILHQSRLIHRNWTPMFQEHVHKTWISEKWNISIFHLRRLKGRKGKAKTDLGGVYKESQARGTRREIFHSKLST